MPDLLAEAGEAARAAVTAFDDPPTLVDMINDMDRDQVDMALFAQTALASVLLRALAAAKGVDGDEYRQGLFLAAYAGAV